MDIIHTGFNACGQRGSEILFHISPRFRNGQFPFLLKNSTNTENKPLFALALPLLIEGTKAMKRAGLL
ncbi:hypothetical protein EG829_08685 [bacterium]|nr:hypothetical protein [bacterium]